MDEPTLAQTICTFLVLAVFLGFFIWALKTGQLKNVEDAKYSIFDDEGEGASEK